MWDVHSLTHTHTHTYTHYEITPGEYQVMVEEPVGNDFDKGMVMVCVF